MGWFELAEPKLPDLDAILEYPEGRRLIAEGVALLNRFYSFLLTRDGSKRVAPPRRQKAVAQTSTSYAANPEILTIPPDELKGMNAETLGDRITINYHRQRPDFGEIKKSAYESLRIGSRPGGKSGPKNYKETREIFYINDGVIKKLIQLEVLRLAARSKNKISPRAIASLYDLVFPQYNSDRYLKVKGLLMETPTIRGDVGKPNDLLVGGPSHLQAISAPVATDTTGVPYVPPPPHQVAPAVAKVSYVPIPLLQQEKMTRGVEYELIPDSDTQHSDAYFVRRREAIQEVRGQKMSEVNSLDVARLRLARHYIKWSRVVEDTDIVARLRARYGGKVEQKRILDDLISVGMPAEFYKTEWGLAPGSVEILLLPQAERDKIAEKAKPLIARYGPFVSFRQVQEIVDKKMEYREFIGHQDKIGLKIKNVTIGNDVRYNLFQVVQMYYDRIK